MSASIEPPTALNNATVASLPHGIPGPTYDRGQVSVGIVHFGVGGFHRAHQAMYLDRLMNQGQALTWGICGVGIMAADRLMKDVLNAQDGLYTLVVKNSDGTVEPTVIGSIIEYLFAPDDPETVIQRMTDPKVQIISLTITEGGYNFNARTGEFDQTNPDVLHDLHPGAAPRTSFGLVTEAIDRRRKLGLAPFTVMSCDNIPGNGDTARRSFAAFAALLSAELAAFVRTNIHFPNSMVDRITPVTTDEDRALLTGKFGIEDRWPVVCEPFMQWVLQDSFGGDRPPLEVVGVQVVSDVEPYELMKLRLLNASHQALGYFGYLAGYRLVNEVCQDPLFARFLLAYMDREATPTLDPVPGIDLDQYKHNLIQRFSRARRSRSSTSSKIS
jgi:mannitol 2-dehydrogenase